MSSEEFKFWANATMSCGFLGGCAGFVHHKLLSGLLSNTRVTNANTATIVVAQTLNSMLIGGLFFALRGAALSALPRPLGTDDARWASLGAGAVTGFGTLGMFSGSARKGCAGALYFGALGYLGQVCTDTFLYSEGHAQVTPAPLPHNYVLLPAERPGVGSSTLSWLPVNMSPRESDEVRLDKERRRLQELDEVLGLATPSVHPKALELAAREKMALKALGKHTA